MVSGSHDFTWLIKLSKYIHIDEAIKEVVLKEKKGAEWEGAIEECKRGLCDLSIKITEARAGDLGGPIGVTAVMNMASPDK